MNFEHDVLVYRTPTLRSYALKLSPSSVDPVIFDARTDSSGLHCFSRISKQSHTVLEPIQAHVNAFGVVLLYSAIDDSVSCCVISFDFCGWMGMSHFRQGYSKWEGRSCIQEECCNFSFSNG